MNYRHLYHAGNFADCFKHVLLVKLLDSFLLKPTPFFVLDTHAGAGRYDLDAAAAQQTKEGNDGIRRLLQTAPATLCRYLALVKQLGLYPGSPMFIRSALRPSDRLVCCEVQSDVVTELRRWFRHDRQVAIHNRSGWEALGALLPPPERRGLVFIDPPFEATDEFAELTEGLRRGRSRFRHGVFAAWYPIKRIAEVRSFHASLTSSGIGNIIAVELRLRSGRYPGRLNGCGLIVINPPYQFEEQGRLIADAVLQGLSATETGAGTTVIRLSRE